MNGEPARAAASREALPTPARRADPPLRRAGVEDVERLSVVLAEAFFEDPVLGWLMPRESKRHVRLRRYFAIELRHLAISRGRVWTTDDLAGAALTLAPGAWRAPTRVSVLEGRAFGARVAMAARLGLAMEWRHLREPHYYVRDVGVRPAMQGRGIGSALLGPTLERCDRESLPAYLEASSELNAALYERLGFQRIRELRVADSPPLRLMVRRPRAAATAAR